MKNKIHKCEKCGQNFTLAWNLKQHLKHSKYCGTSDEEFKCANCGKKFTLSATLKHHFARCIAVDPYRFACTHCPRKFTFKSSLRKHLRGRCPNISYDSAKEINDEVYEIVDFQELEEVHIDEIDFNSADIKKQFATTNVKIEKILLESDEEEEVYKACDVEGDNIDLLTDTNFIYQDDNSLNDMEFIQT